MSSWSVIGSFQLFFPFFQSPSPTRHSIRSSAPPFLPLRLDSGACPLTAKLNRDSRLVVEIDRKALVIFIDSLIYQKNNFPPPHQGIEKKDFCAYSLKETKVSTHFLWLSELHYVKRSN